MKFTHICRYVRENPWAITEDKLGDILDVLVSRMTGERFTEDEIKARVGDAMNANQARIEAAAATARDSGRMVAVLPLLGTIYDRSATLAESSGGTSVRDFKADFRQAMADPAVGTILIDTDSPGGTVAGVRELADEVFEARGQGKRIMAMADSMMASAAYWIASQADEIIGTPSSLTGSIGVFTAHEDISKMAELKGVKVTLISAGKYKTEGNPFEPLSEEARDQLQGRVDEAYSEFVKAVARGRGVKAADVRGGYGQGRTLPAKKALEAGLIDRIETRDDAIASVIGSRSGMRANITPDWTLDSDRLRRLERF